MSTRNGVVNAFVKKVDARQGRVIVEYRAIDDQLESAWAPIASPMSGKGRGALFMPEPGDQVLVAFHDGRFDSPYVVGFLWNGDQVSPEDSPDNRVIVTPGGHQLRFEDKDGAKRVVLTSEGQLRVELDDANRRIVVTDKETKNHVTIDLAGSIRIEAGAQVTVEAPHVYLTDSGSHPVTYGDELLQYINAQLITALQSHLHPAQLALGIFPVVPAPPIVPFPPATPAIYSSRVTTG
jgi:phage baseplate assembly protein gpV